SVRMNVASKSQFAEIFRRPSFFIWFFLMLLTAATELAPGQWVDVALTSVVGMRGVLLLVYVSAIMFVARHFAGPLAHKLSPEGLLASSSALAFVGLLSLSVANSPVTAMLAATAWGFGVCYLWPTMIAVAAERYPRGGALAIGLMGVAGSISSYVVLPLLGKVYDTAKIEAAGGAAQLATLSREQLQSVLVFAAGESFRVVSAIPAFLVFAFLALWFFTRRSRAARGAMRTSILNCLALAAIAIGGFTTPLPPALAAEIAGEVPATGNSGLRQQGDALYQQICAACHGGDGSGGPGGAPDLRQSAIATAADGGRTLKAFLDVGRPERGMAPFLLSEAQNAQLAATLRSLRAAAEAATGADSSGVD